MSILRVGPTKLRILLVAGTLCVLLCGGEVALLGGTWLLFDVGVLAGVGVQLLTLGALADGLGLDYRLATALAVLAAVLHNFV